MKGASKDLKPVFAWAKARGWTATKLKRRNHIKLTKPGHRTVFSSLTTSDHRMPKNLKAELLRSEAEAENEKG